MMCDITRKPLFCNYILSKVSNKRAYDNIKNLPVSYDVVLYEMLPLDHKRSSVDQHYMSDKVFINVKSNFKKSIPYFCVGPRIIFNVRQT